MNRERIIVVILELIGSVGYSFGCHFSASDSINKLKLFISESNISLVELISDSPPPIFIFRLLNELCNHIILFLLGNLLQIFVIAKVFELVIPSIGNAADFDLSEFVFLIEGLVAALLVLELF